MLYKKYQHVEKIGSEETEGLLNGTVHIFHKIDGTNGCVFLDDEGNLAFGNRTKQLKNGEDNYNFVEHFKQNPTTAFKLKKMLSLLPKRTIIYGEWLIPVFLKTYNKDAWKHFYIFDVVTYPDDLPLEVLLDSHASRRNEKYLPYDVYKRLCDELELLYIPLIKTLNNPNIDELTVCLEETTFLIEKGVGEGIVIKNYEYKNPYGRSTWGKLLNADFTKRKNKVRTSNKENKNNYLWEYKIISKYCNTEFISKEIFKFKENNPKMFDSYNKFINKNFPILINYVFEEFLKDNLIIAIKEYKNLTLNFTILKKLIAEQIKEIIL